MINILRCQTLHAIFYLLTNTKLTAFSQLLKMAGCSTSKFNRKIEIIEIRDDSLLRFSLDNGLLLSDLKREVKSAIEKKVMIVIYRNSN